MKLRAACVVVGFLSLSLSLAQLTVAQTTTETASALPRLVRFGGTVKDLNGNLLTGVVGITFALYSEQTGGTALWLETQNVTADSNGRYTVLLGSTKPDGLPTDLFTTEQARWVGVQVSGQAEQPRVLLVSAPYALKAGDAETVGGLPASAFVLAAPMVAASGNAEANATGNVAASSAAAAQAATSSDVTTTGGTVNTIPLFTTATNIQNSILTQTSTTAINVRGKLNLPGTGTATSSKGYNSQPADFVASVFNSSTSAAVPQTFQWQAEPVNNDKSTASGTLNLLFGEGTSKPSETGLNIASNGQITFAKGQAFPGTGDGTVTSVGSGAGLTGGPITGSGTLSLASNACAAGNALSALPFTCSPFATLGANSFTGNQTVTGNLTDTGNISSTGSITGQTGSFSGNNSSQIVNVTQSGGGNGISATSTSGVGLSGVGIYGVQGQSATVGGPGVYGIASAAGSEGVFGVELATSGTNYGMYGQNASAIGAGASGMSTSGKGTGVLGQAPGSTFSGTGASLAGKYAFGVAGDTSANGVFASGVMGTGDDAVGVLAENNSTNLATLYVVNHTAVFNNGGKVFFGGMPDVLGSAGVAIGDAGCASGFMALQLGSAFNMANCVNYTLLGDTTGNTYVNAHSGADIHFRLANVEQMTITNGNVDVLGTLSKGGGSFKIDHPLDPANKYLYHSFVESPDMKNMYDGNVTTDNAGLATVALPDWFETLNRDFRYQLTVIGQFAQAIVARKIANNSFEIRTSVPNVEVSWQVTGTRQDAFANSHRIQVEVEKAPADRGHYLYPELVGAPETARIGYMAPAPGGEHIADHRREMPRRGNAAPPPQRTPLSIPIPRRPAPPNPPPPRHSLLPAAQGNKPEVNQR